MTRLIFTEANLLDGENPSRPDVTVVVEGDRIASVSDGAPTPNDVGPEDRVIPLGGKTLMPGLITCHFHTTYTDWGYVPVPQLGLEHPPAYLSLLAARNLRTALDWGYTSVVGSSVGDHIDATLKEALAAGVIEGPRLFAGSVELMTSGDVADCDNRVWFYQLGNTGAVRIVDGPDGFRRAVREELGRGADIVKVAASGGHGVAPAGELMSMSRDEIHAAADAAHGRGKRIRAHAASRPSILECARASYDVIDHADRVDEECIEAILQAGSFVAPSMLFTHRFIESTRRASGYGLPISEFSNEEQTVREARTRGVIADFEYTSRMLPIQNEAGVKLVVGDDYGTALAKHGEYTAELELYVKEIGIPPLDVIRWATVNGADLMGMRDDLGTVSPGKLADLLVVDGDPSFDISCLGDRENLHAILQGGVFSKDAL